MFAQSSKRMPVKFKDVTACFSVEEWTLLHEREKLFYRTVMKEIHQALIMLGYHILNPETLLRVITCVYQEDDKNPKSGADIHDSTSSHDPATDPTPGILLRIQYKEEQSSRDLQRSEEIEIGTVPSTGPLMETPDFSLQIKEEEDPVFMSSEGRAALACDPENGTLVKTECLKTNQLKINFQREKWDLTDEEHEQSTELINKLVHFQNNEIPWTSVECEKHNNGNTRNKPFKSTAFKKTFNDLSGLKMDHGIHAGGKPFNCTQCEKHFTNISGLKRHQKFHTGEKPYECTECEKHFTYLSHLKGHQRIHTGEKPYECTECWKRFHFSSALKSHQRYIHATGKPYKCTVCRKSFPDSSALIRHQRIHSGERPFRCTECKKGFFYFSALKEHERIHTGEKPYECTRCKKVFSRLSAMKKHQRIHTGDKTYEC